MITFDTDGLPVRHGVINIAFAMADVHAVFGGLVDREVTDETARTIAAQWQSSSHLDRQTAALASGREYDTDGLLDEIARHRASTQSEDEQTALDCLATWALNRRGALL